MNRESKAKGFTLIEVILTMSLITIVALVASPFYGRFLSAQEISIVEDELSGSFAKAQMYSMLGKSDALWGVAVRDEQIILFQGDSYSDRDQSFDEVFVMQGKVSVTGFSEVVFAKVTGKPNVMPAFTVSGSGVTDTFILNTAGVLLRQ